MKVCKNGHLGQSKKCGACKDPADYTFGKMIPMDDEERAKLLAFQRVGLRGRQTGGQRSRVR